MNLKWSRSSIPRKVWRTLVSPPESRRAYVLRDYAKPPEEELCGTLRVIAVWDTRYNPDPYAAPTDEWVYIIGSTPHQRTYTIGEVDRYTAEEAKRACEAIYILGHDLRAD